MKYQLLRNTGRRYKKEYKYALKLIKEYDDIVIFRHVIPDFDALGSQYGMANYIKSKFPNKHVYCVGENHPSLNYGLFPEADVLEESFYSRKFLAIIVDVSDKARISDQHFEKASAIVKFDHHPNNNNFANVNVTDTSFCAAAEMVASFCYYVEKYSYIGYNAAKNLYIGIVGDSGRFLYSSTTAHTFELSSKLVQEGLILPAIYSQMYEKDIKSLEITKKILNNYKISEHGVAYYVLTEADNKELGIDKVSGKEYVNTFSNIKGIEIWASVSEDIEKKCFWISLRSKGLPINTIANKYQGGGHLQASGCRIETLDELPNLIKDLDDLIANSQKENN